MAQALRKSLLLYEIAAGCREPHFKLLEMIFDYITRAPDLIHYPKEDEVLFHCIYERSPEVRLLMKSCSWWSRPTSISTGRT